MGYLENYIEKGYARLEKISFDSCNESTIFADVMNRYKERTGHYPKLGHPCKNQKSTGEEYQDNTDRVEVERFFSAGKRCNGTDLIVTKLEETTLSSIAMSILITNLFAVDLRGVFCFTLQTTYQAKIGRIISL